MGSVPTPRTFQAGEIETAAYLNSLSQVLNFMQNPPRCSVWNNATANTLVSGTGASIAFDSELYDTDNMHSTTSNTTRLTAQTPGLYDIKGSADFGSSSSGTRQISIYKNGSAQAFDSDGAMAAADVLFLSKEIYLAAGDYVELWALQTTGANLTMPTGQSLLWFSARWVAIS